MTQTSPYSLVGKRVCVAGHRGLVGSAIVRRLAHEPLGELVTTGSDDLDLRVQQATNRFVASARPDVVFLAAAKVGGINANRSAQGEFLYDNLMINANVVEAARANEVERTVILGSSCIYPRDARQPITESALLTGPLEETNEGYAVAKIAALELAKRYRRQYAMNVVSVMPTNLYGPNDNFDPATSHVLPALLRRFHEARAENADEVNIWGSGRPRREFLHVDDLADAVVHIATHYDGDLHINAGAGSDITIATLADLIADVVGWSGRLVFDRSMPDGTPQKLLDTTRLRALGWAPSIGLRDGIESTYRWFVTNKPNLRGA